MDLNKPFWKDMQSKPSQELNSIKGNRLFDCPVTVVLGNESNLTIFYVQDTLVCNSHPVYVLA